MKTILSFVLMLAAGTAMAQGLEREYDAECHCFVVTNHFDEGQVSSVHHELGNGTKNGVETVYYPSGQIQYTRTWSQGALSGTGTHYHPNGNTHYQEHYTNGAKSGTWTFYDDAGTVLYAIEYAGNGTDFDGEYTYYHDGVLYLTQTVSNGAMVQESVINQEIYDALKEEAEMLMQQGKP